MVQNTVIKIIRYLLQEEHRHLLQDLSGEQIKEKLLEKGFKESEINSTLKLFNLNPERQKKPGRKLTLIRSFHDLERLIISGDAQSFLYQLHEIGLINNDEMETIINESMMISDHKIKNDTIWIIIHKFLLEKHGFSFFLYGEHGDYKGKLIVH